MVETLWFVEIIYNLWQWFRTSRGEECFKMTVLLNPGRDPLQRYACFLNWGAQFRRGALQRSGRSSVCTHTIMIRGWLHSNMSQKYGFRVSHYMYKSLYHWHKHVSQQQPYFSHAACISWHKLWIHVQRSGDKRSPEIKIPLSSSRGSQLRGLE